MRQAKSIGSAYILVALLMGAVWAVESLEDGAGVGESVVAGAMFGALWPAMTANAVYHAHQRTMKERGHTQ